MNYKMKHKLFLFTSVAIVLAVSGCASLPSFQSGYRLPPPVDSSVFTMKQGTVQPDETMLESDAIKVLMNIEKSRYMQGDDLRLFDQLTEKLPSGLQKQGKVIEDGRQNIEMLERVRQALVGYRGKSKEQYRGESTVDYFIDISLTESSFTKAYKAPGLLKRTASVFRDKPKGSCEYVMKGSITVDLAPMPELHGEKRLIAEESQEFALKAEGVCVDNSTEVINRRSAAEQKILQTIVSCTNRALEDFLRPRAYITRHYSDGKRFVYEISAGKRAGFSEGEAVIIEQLDPDVTGKYNQVVKARVKEVESNRAFIEMTDPVAANLVGLFDRVTLQRGGLLLKTRDLGCHFNVSDY